MQCGDGLSSEYIMDSITFVPLSETIDIILGDKVLTKACLIHLKHKYNGHAHEGAEGARITEGWQS
jgi:hypothetical protein